MWKNIFLESCLLSALIFGGFYINTKYIKEELSKKEEKTLARISGAATIINNISGKKFKRIDEAISLDKVTFSYIDGDGPAIEDVSLTIKRNQVTAIVGSSGAGKSTIIDILTGLQKPDSGTVNVDGINLNDFNLELKSLSLKLYLKYNSSVKINILELLLKQ